MPISEAMRAANRANAQASTGPRTEAGKRRARLNAVKHGLASRSLKTVVLPEEDAAEYAALEADLMARAAPQGELERAAAKEMAAALWRTRRAPAAEVAALVGNADEEEFEEAPLAATLAAPGAVDIMLRIGRYEGQLRRAYERAHQRLMTLQQARLAEARRAAAAAPPTTKPAAAPAKPAPAPAAKGQFSAGDGFVSPIPPRPAAGPLAQALMGSASPAALGQAPPRAA